MVTRAGRYYRTAFQGAHGVTQGFTLSPIIFNVVMDAVLRHWVKIVVEGKEEQGELEQEGRNQATLFYTDYGMVAS